MNLSERIRAVRKNAKLSQTEFGEKLGVSQSVIANIELDLNKNGIPENIIKLICYIFSVNEKWLRTGEGEMNTESKESLLEKLKDTYKLSNLEFAILHEYLNLDKNQRIAFENFIDNVLNTKSPTKEEKEDEYITTVAAKGNSELNVKIKKSDVEED